jgi:hypothetical protein
VLEPVNGSHYVVSFDVFIYHHQEKEINRRLD